jgi:hypothetical protein
MDAVRAPTREKFEVVRAWGAAVLRPYEEQSRRDLCNLLSSAARLGRQTLVVIFLPEVGDQIFALHPAQRVL